MNEYLIEPFLTAYFLLEAVTQGFVNEKTMRKNFFELASVFSLRDREQLKEYYSDSQNEPFSEVKSTETYERLCRTIEFAQKSGQDIDITPRDTVILAQKRKAMAIKAKLFDKVKSLTRETVSSTLINTALNGSIDAMNLLSFMEYHGIGICKDTVNAVKRIRLCAKWNDLFACLMGIRYDSLRADEYYSILYSVLRNAQQKQVFDYIVSANVVIGDVKKNCTARIIEKAFAMGILKRETYDRTFAKVAFSELISIEDKEKILLTKQNSVQALSDIPFDQEKNEITFDEGCLSGMTLVRENEVRGIMRNVSVALNCPRAAYKPLLVLSEDEYVSGMYAEHIRKGFGTTPVIEVDAGTLTPSDLSGSGKNVFLRGLSETKATGTVFMIKHCQDLEPQLVDELENLLDIEYRRKLRLLEPPVSIDISGIMIILFADEKSSKLNRLKEKCETLVTDKISRAERACVADAVFVEQSRAFGCHGITVEKGCNEFLAQFETGRVLTIVDSVLRDAVLDKGKVITLQMVERASKDFADAAPRRTFGYTSGGNYNA